MKHTPRFSSLASATRDRSSFVLRRSSFVIATVALSAFAANAAPRVPYANDFSTRTSGATPSDRWMESPYITGALVRSVNSAGDAYNGVTAYQDGWTMKAGYNRSGVLFRVADDNGNQGALVNANSSSYQGNATVAMQPFYNEFTDGVLKISVDIRTPAQTDSFNPANNAYALCAPVYKSTLDVTASTFSYPMYFGPASLYDDRGGKEGQEGKPLGWFLRAVSRGRTAANANASYFGQYDSRNSITAGSWMRYEAVLDLDAGTYTATFTDLGTTHPTPSTMGGSPVAFHRWESDNTQFSFSFVNPMTAATGGIAGLAFYVQGIKQAASTADAPMFDNIAVSWKAPGAEDFASVYENDFSTRRYRQIEPAGATSGAYALAPTTNTVQSSSYGASSVGTVYAAGDSSLRLLVPARRGVSNTLEPAGLDGWRRFEGVPGCALVNPTSYGWNNGTVLRVTAPSTNCGKSQSHAHLATPLGTALTSGVVRLYFDLMTPAKWQFPSDMNTAWAGVYLGSAHDATLITGSNDAKVIMTNKYACGGGYYINGSNGGTTTSSKWMGSASAAPTATLTGIDDAKPGNARWYRFRVTADLESKRYDIEAWGCGSQSGDVVGPLGRDMNDTSFMTDDMLRLASSNRAFHVTSPAAIDSIVLSVNHASAYGDNSTRSGDTFKVGNYPLFDNIRVCRVNEDGTDGFEIYRNDFDSSYRTSVQDAAVLAGNTDRDGADRWIRRHRNVGSINVIDANGGDGVVAMTGVGRTSDNRTMFAVQPFGASSKNCASVDFAADIRPPACFSPQTSSDTISSGFAYVEVGGDNYYQGVYRPASDNNWRAEPRIGFGFTAVSGKDACSQFTNVVISVQTRTSSETSTRNSTAAIDKSHWYRFRVKAAPTSAGGTFTVKVYDQGATKPAASDADGTLVETFSDLALPAFGGQGMTTFGLAASNFSGTRGGGIDDPNVALVDNLSADFNPAAFMLILR